MVVSSAGSVRAYDRTPGCVFRKGFRLITAGITEADDAVWLAVAPAAYALMIVLQVGSFVQAIG